MATKEKEIAKNEMAVAEKPASRAATSRSHAAASHSAAAPAAREHKAPASAKHRYTEAVGRRKTAIARVRIMPGTGKMTVNGKTPVEYFTLPRLVQDARSPLEQLKLTEYDVTVLVSGGGIHAQAGAVRLGLSRAIIAKSPDWKPRLRTMGFLTRDSRMVERKKYGLNKARRAPQWAKR
ncbi:MAG TPA: 30S ribosomal protein S9 [Candidatus Paceibacterota bacterium]|nr:30S ribosomal protein S9 [Candidatus Paceibacterota bacterium]